MISDMIGHRCDRLDASGAAQSAFPEAENREIRVASGHRLAIQICGQEYRELSALSGRYRVSDAWLWSQAVIEFLDRYEKVELQLPLNLSSERRGSSS